MCQKIAPLLGAYLQNSNLFVISQYQWDRTGKRWNISFVISRPFKLVFLNLFGDQKWSTVRRVPSLVDRFYVYESEISDTCHNNKMRHVCFYCFVVFQSASVHNNMVKSFDNSRRAEASIQQKHDRSPVQKDGDLFEPSQSLARV